MKLFFVVFSLSLSISVFAKNLKVMAYNVENLFDTIHDENTDDYTYLPQTEKKSIPGFAHLCQAYSSRFYVEQCLNLDWNENILQRKIENIARVIKSFDSAGKGPDILILEEVENINVLSQLVTKGLQGLGYNHKVLIEGDDSRGIDVALISKFPVITAKRHPLIVRGKPINTRGILEVTINFEGKQVTVFGNHWPSQANPAVQRATAAEQLAILADKSKSALILAVGDFNTLTTDSPYPFSYLGNFIDSEVEARKVQSALNGGTHFYRGKWSSLDKIFIHKKSTISPDFSKFQIINRPFMLETDRSTGEKVPKRFDPNKGEGFADHLPLGMTFDL